MTAEQLEIQLEDARIEARLAHRQAEERFLTIGQLRYCLARVVAHLRDPESAYARGDDDVEAIDEAEAALRGEAARGWLEAEARRQDGAAEQYFESQARIALLEAALTSALDVAPETVAHSADLPGLVAAFRLDLLAERTRAREALLDGSADDLVLAARLDDLERTAKRAAALLRCALQMHMDGYWVAPTRFMGEADVVVAHLDHLAGRE